MWIWLPGAGICAALIGLLIAPAAVRVRGLYLGILTVGLVFIGIHLSRLLPEISGPAEVGRNFPPLELKFWKEDEPFISFTEDGHWLWFDISGNAKTYLFCLGLMIVGLLVAKNLVRSRTGRALQAIRDRDVAAEIMGVPEVKYKLIGVRHLVVLRRRRRGGVRLVRRPPATRVLGPHPVGRVHRHPARRRRRHRCRHARRDVLRRAAAAVHGGLRQLDVRAVRRIGTMGLVLGRSRQQRTRTTSGSSRRPRSPRASRCR